MATSHDDYMQPLILEIVWEETIALLSEGPRVSHWQQGLEQPSPARCPPAQMFWITAPISWLGQIGIIVHNIWREPGWQRLGWRSGTVCWRLELGPISGISILNRKKQVAGDMKDFFPENAGELLLVRIELNGWRVWVSVRQNVDALSPSLLSQDYLWILICLCEIPLGRNGFSCCGYRPAKSCCSVNEK